MFKFPDELEKKNWCTTEVNKLPSQLYPIKNVSIFPKNMKFSSLNINICLCAVFHSIFYSYLTEGSNVLIIGVRNWIVEICTNFIAH